MCVLAAGMSHIFDNITKDVLKCLDEFPRFQEQLRSLVDLLSVEHYRSRPVAGNRSVQDILNRTYMDGKKCAIFNRRRLVATCFVGSPFEKLMKYWDGGTFILWRYLDKGVHASFLQV